MGGANVKGSRRFETGLGQGEGSLVAEHGGTDWSVIAKFLVPAGTTGLTVEQTWDSLGMRATCSNDLHIDAHVPADTLLGGVEGLALLVAQIMPHWMVASYAAVYVGVAQAAVDPAVAHVNERKA